MCKIKLLKYGMNEEWKETWMLYLVLNEKNEI